MNAPILSMHTWTSLPNDVRARIRALFSIPRSSHVIVNDGRIETDGTTFEDFKHLTIDKMQAYTGSDTADFHQLFDMTVAKVVEESTAPTFTVTPIVNTIVFAEPKKRNKKNETTKK